jgi:hypothetical protein
MEVTMESRLIDVHGGSQYESWLIIFADGRMEYHFANGGHYCMRHGAEPEDTPIDIVSVGELEKSHGKDLVQKVRAALAEMGKPT